MAVQFGVDLVFRSQTRALEQVSDKLQGVDRTADKLKGKNPFQGVERGAKSAGDAAARAGKQAEAAAGGFDRLGKAVGGLVSAYALLSAGKFVIAKTAELETQTRSIQVLTGSLEKAKGVISELQQFANVTPFTSTELIETAKRLKAFGVDTEKLVDTTKRLGDVAGATGADLSGIATAYGQIMAKGRLQGEELLQLQERGINLQSELQKMYGLTADEFRDALEKGKFSAQAVELALKRLTDAGGTYANGAIAQSDTLAGKFSTLQDSIENVAKTLGQVLTPAFNVVLNEAIKLANQINEVMQTTLLMQNLGGAMSTGQRDKWWQEAGKDAESIAKLRNNGMRDFPAIRDQLFRDKMRQYGYDSGLFKPPTAAAPTAGPSAVPALLGGTSKAGAGRSGGPKLPAYIDKEVLRKWLISQGMGRTSGDFTNAGHRTPNHMLNAMDMGFTSSKYDSNYVQKTKEMEAKLRATGAFGDQLFGPTRDPRGHKDHLHIPTPGGKVKMNPALASLMGMSGGGEEGQYELAQGLAEQEAQRAEQLQRSFEMGTKLTTEFTRQNELLTTGTEEARRRLEIQYQYQDREQQIAELMDAGQQKELQALNEKLKAAELQKLERDLLVEKAQLLEGALRPIADENEMLAARLAGTEKELEMKRQIAALTNAGMESGAATDMVQLNQQLKAQVEAQDKAKASAEALAGSISSALTSSLRGLIDGSMTAEQALSNAFKGIGDAFLDMAMQMIQQWLTMQIMGLVGSFFGGAGGSSIVGGQSVPLSSMPAGMAFASGGSTPVNQPVLVGERGPELFVPGQSGGITNHQNLRSMMASGQSSSQDGGNGMNINMSFQTTKFMDREWVDREQLDAAMAQAAKSGAERGHQRTLDKLRQSPSTRRRVGI